VKALRFADLFDGIGTEALAFSDVATRASGDEVAVSGYLSWPHRSLESARSDTKQQRPVSDPRNGVVLLVNEPGACPDCAPAPVPAITLPGFSAVRAKGTVAVRLRGRLEYGFALDAGGNASFLRLLDARLDTGLGGSRRAAGSGDRDSAKNISTKLKRSLRAKHAAR
jgi:hypothetical protein